MWCVTWCLTGVVVEYGCRRVANIFRSAANCLFAWIMVKHALAPGVLRYDKIR